MSRSRCTINLNRDIKIKLIISQRSQPWSIMIPSRCASPTSRIHFLSLRGTSPHTISSLFSSPLLQKVLHLLIPPSPTALKIPTPWSSASAQKRTPRPDIAPAYRARVLLLRGPDYQFMVWIAQGLIIGRWPRRSDNVDSVSGKEETTDLLPRRSDNVARWYVSYTTVKRIRRRWTYTQCLERKRQLRNKQGEAETI